jgi:hypothetical protein
MNRAQIRILSSIAFAIGLMAAGTAQAMSVAFDFSGAVSSIDAGAPGFDSSLSGVTAGTAVTATVTFNGSNTPSANPFGGTFADATLYSFSSYTISATVTGVGTFSGTSGDLGAFVWDDAASISGNDGLLFTNIAFVNDLQIQLGNILLSTSTFSNEDLPLADVPGLFALSLGASGAGQTWLTAVGSGLTFHDLSVTAPVPEPATLALLLTGMGIAGVARCKRTRQG